MTIRFDQFKKTVLSRPDQTLFRHLNNMLQEFSKKAEIIFLPFNGAANLKVQDLKFKIGRLFLKLYICLHDFGKVNPFFQVRIDNPYFSTRLKQVQGKYAHYHAQLSGLAFWLVTSEIIDDIEMFAREECGCSSIDLLAFQEEVRTFQLMLTYGIFYHHHRGTLPNGLFALLVESGDQFRFKDIMEIIAVAKIIVPDIEANLKAFYLDLLDDSNASKIDQYLHITMEKLFIKYDEDDFIDLSYEIEDLWEDRKSKINLLYLLYYYSILCDLDEWDAKSHLDDSEAHSINFFLHYASIPCDLIAFHRNKKFPPITENALDPLLRLKRELWSKSNAIENHEIGSIVSVKYPTGSGKTLAYLNIAMKIREQYLKNTGLRPKIVYCLPFISITDQVGEIMKSILKERALYSENDHDQVDLFQYEGQNELLAIHHHLCETNFSYVAFPEEEQMNISPSWDDYYLWKSSVILTTFVGFWNSLFGGSKRDYLRLHRLIGSIVVLDEIQNLPLRYWKLVSKVLHLLTRELGCTIIVGSATNPQAITYPFDAQVTEDLKISEKKTIQIHADYSALGLKRFVLRYRSNKRPFSEFLREFPSELERSGYLKVMLLLNTRKAARFAFDYLEKRLDQWSVLFLSSAVRYCDRTEILRTLQEMSQDSSSRVLLVCTQVIEAGVDVSFELIYRDVAPLDSLIQTAGRCNRYNEGAKPGSVCVLELENDLTSRGAPFSGIYDDILLNLTRELLCERQEFTESDLYATIDEYYSQISLSRHPKKKIDHGLEFFVSAQISDLSEEFRLIDDQANTLFLIEEEGEFLKIQGQLSDLARSNSNVVRQCRPYSLSISDKTLEQLTTKCSRIPGFFFRYEKRSEPIYFCCLARFPELYQKSGGLASSLL